jgi:TetR/AcrR family transcriptional regulator
MHHWPAPSEGASSRRRRPRRPPEDGRRIRLSTAARRQQLIDTARRVFAERGFRGTTTREIASAAGVTEAVIFQHFPHKDLLYEAILEQKAVESVAERWFAEMEAASAAGDDRELLRILYAGLLDQHERDPYYLRLTLYSALEEHPLAGERHAYGTRLYTLIERHITRAQAEGRFRHGPAQVLVRAVLALPVYHVLQERVLKTPWPDIDRQQVVDQGVTFALGGLQSEAAAGEVRS